MLNLIAAARARRKPPSGRGFYLEKEPMPKVLPGQGLGDGDDEVQELVADGPGDELPSYMGDCHHCGARIRWKPSQALRGGFWAHVGISGLDHDAEPLRIAGYTGQSPQRIEDAMAKFEEAVLSGTLRGPTPIADDLRADRERLLAANGTLARRVRTLEAQLRAAGIEPAPRSAT